MVVSEGHPSGPLPPESTALELGLSRAESLSAPSQGHGFHALLCLASWQNGGVMLRSARKELLQGNLDAASHNWGNGHSTIPCRTKASS